MIVLDIHYFLGTNSVCQMFENEIGKSKLRFNDNKRLEDCKTTETRLLTIISELSIPWWLSTWRRWWCTSLTRGRFHQHLFARKRWEAIFWRTVFGEFHMDFSFVFPAGFKRQLLLKLNGRYFDKRCLPTSFHLAHKVWRNRPKKNWKKTFVSKQRKCNPRWKAILRSYPNIFPRALGQCLPTFCGSRNPY